MATPVQQGNSSLDLSVFNNALQYIDYWFVPAIVWAGWLAEGSVNDRSNNGITSGNDQKWIITVPLRDVIIRYKENNFQLLVI